MCIFSNWKDKDTSTKIKKITFLALDKYTHRQSGMRDVENVLHRQNRNAVNFDTNLIPEYFSRLYSLQWWCLTITMGPRPLNKLFQLIVCIYGVSTLVFMLFRFVWLLTQARKYQQNDITWFKDKIDTVIVISIVWPLYLLYIIFQVVFNPCCLWNNSCDCLKSNTRWCDFPGDCFIVR